MSGLRRAVVVSTGRNSAWVALDGEASPRLAQLRRMSGPRSMPVPGDVVDVRILEDDRTVVDNVRPRVFSLERQSVDGRRKTIAANVDLLVTVTALANPPPRLTTLDQLLAFAERADLEALVLLTKPDLAGPAQIEALGTLYRGLGYRTVVCNPKAGVGIDELRAAIHGRRALLAGVSGVGKSTIFRALGGDSAVGEVSRRGLGRQTTSAARLYRMGDGFLIDSPGVSEFGLGKLDAEELAAGFREIGALHGTCRFADCTHIQEPGCAVLEALQAGRIGESRYASYRKILLEPS
jgi:ribosome biogenesis GTPase